MGMTRKGTGRIGAGEPPRRRDRRMAGDPAVRDAAHRLESGLAVKRADRVARPGISMPTAYRERSGVRNVSTSSWVTYPESVRGYAAAFIPYGRRNAAGVCSVVGP